MLVEFSFFPDCVRACVRYMLVRDTWSEAKRLLRKKQQQPGGVKYHEMSWPEAKRNEGTIENSRRAITQLAHHHRKREKLGGPKPDLANWYDSYCSSDDGKLHNHVLIETPLHSAVRRELTNLDMGYEMYVYMHACMYVS